MATFAELKTEAAAKLQDSSATAVSAASVGAEINNAINYWKKRRFWFNEITESLTLTTSSSTITGFTSSFQVDLPPNSFFISYASMYYPLAKVSPAEFYEMDVGGSGLPIVFTWDAGTYKTYYYPDQAYTVIVRGLKEYAALSADADTNDFTNYADRIILYDALSRLYSEYRQDDKMEAYYSARVKDEYNEAKVRTFRSIGTGRLKTESIV